MYSNLRTALTWIWEAGLPGSESKQHCGGSIAPYSVSIRIRAEECKRGAEGSNGATDSQHPTGDANLLRDRISRQLDGAVTDIADRILDFDLPHTRRIPDGGGGGKAGRDLHAVHGHGNGSIDLAVHAKRIE